MRKSSKRLLRKFALLAFVAFSAFARDFFVGDAGYGPSQQWHSLSPVVLASDGDTFYVFRHNGMNRVRPDGTIVDAEAFPVPEMTSAFSAAYGRGIIVVTYSDRGDYFVNDGLAAAFRTDGTLLWWGQVAPRRSHVVYDGRDFVVLFEYDGDVQAHVLDDQGFLTEQMTLADQPDLYVRSTPVAVRTDRGLLAVFRDAQSSVYTLAFDASGPLGEPLKLAPGAVRSFGGATGTFDVASNGSGALVMWTNATGRGVAPVVAQHVDASGVPVTQPFDVPFYRDARQPAVQWDGSRYQLAWTVEDSTIAAATVDDGSTTISSLEMVASGYGLLSPALAIAKQRVLLAWINYGEGGARGKVANTGAPFAQSPEQFLKTDPNDAFNPAAVWAGDRYVMAWFRTRRTRTGNVIAVRRFDARGVSLDAEPIVVSNEIDSWVPAVRIASNGAETAVVWTDDTRLFVSRIAANGARIDAEPMVVATDARSNSADIASDGQNFAIAWSDGDTVHVRRLSARGGFIDETTTTLGEFIGRDVSVVRLAWTGQDYLAGFIAGSDVFATLFETASPIVVMEQSNELVLASNGSTHLFAGSKLVLTDASLRVQSVSDAPHGLDAAVWTGTSFFGSGVWGSMWISTAGTVVTSPLPSHVYYPVPQTAAASRGDGTALLIYSTPTRTDRAALYARIVAPKRRAAE